MILQVVSISFGGDRFGSYITDKNYTEDWRSYRQAERPKS